MKLSPVPQLTAAICALALCQAAWATPPYFPNLKRPQVEKIEPGTGGDENIVLIVICPARPDHMTVFGYDKPTTKHLAKLADEGISFTRMYANAPWTRASTACILTGENSSRNNCQRDIDKLSPKKLNIAQRLRKAGYRTAGFVANGNASSMAHLHRGFEVYRDSQTYWHKLANGAEVVDEAVTWLESVKKQKTFTLMFFVDPHDPYKAPPEYEKRYLPEGFTGEPRRRASWEYNNKYPEAERQQLLAIYDAGMNYTDDQIGRFIKKLKANKLYDKTTIVVTGDHGEGFGEHGYYLHAHHFEDEIIRVPLIIKRPGISPAGGYNDGLVNSIDVVPTILEIAGQKIPTNLTGLPLLSTLAGKGIPQDRVIYSEYNEFGIRRAAIIRRDAKVILERPAYQEYLSARLGGRLELLPTVSFDKEVITYYKMDTDPFEKTNAYTPNHPVAGPLLKQLRVFIEGGEEQADGVEIWCKKSKKRCRHLKKKEAAR